MVTPIQSRTELLDFLWECQNRNGFIRDEDVRAASEALAISKIEVEGVISFYHFFHREPCGEFVVYLNNSIVAKHKGFDRIRAAFERETGERFDQPGPGARYSLFETACIGLSDQEPSALINFRPFTNLNTLRVKEVVTALNKGASVDELCDEVPENVRFVPGDRAVLLRDYERGSAVRRLVGRDPDWVLNELEATDLGGRGGAFFPLATKWRVCRRQPVTPKYVVCNADEGEPGTFKDRVLMQRLPGVVFEGMIVAAFAVGASEGILYLRAEYFWLKPRLDAEIEALRSAGLLGENVAGIEGFDFDVRIQMGAGSYVAGEETALLSSLEGKRAEPRSKYYYPTQKGFLDLPTVVNNVESLAAAARVIELGAEQVRRSGTASCPGTKLISVSGDCRKPGLYEIEWGTTVREVLGLCGAKDPHYIQLSGPSGECVSMNQADRAIAKDDLRCGGAFMVFDRSRDILSILRNFIDFFKHESCGICTPCRAGNFIVQRKLELIGSKLARAKDFQDLRDWSTMIQAATRCGLGHSSTHALITALDRFPEYFESRLQEGDEMHFDLAAAVREYDEFGA